MEILRFRFTIILSIKRIFFGKNIRSKECKEKSEIYNFIEEVTKSEFNEQSLTSKLKEEFGFENISVKLHNKGQKPAAPSGAAAR